MYFLLPSFHNIVEWRQRFSAAAVLALIALFKGQFTLNGNNTCIFIPKVVPLHHY
jgi:hypothetical protein